MGYTLTGPAALTKNEVAQIASKAIGKLRVPCLLAVVVVVAQHAIRAVNAVQVDDAAIYKSLLGYQLPPRYAFLLTNLGQTYRLQLRCVQMLVGYFFVTP